MRASCFKHNLNFFATHGPHRSLDTSKQTCTFKVQTRSHGTESCAASQEGTRQRIGNTKDGTLSLQMLVTNAVSCPLITFPNTSFTPACPFSFGALTPGAIHSRKPGLEKAPTPTSQKTPQACTDTRQRTSPPKKILLRQTVAQTANCSRSHTSHTAPIRWSSSSRSHTPVNSTGPVEITSSGPQTGSSHTWMTWIQL